jgi:hypothetical protein
MSQNPASPSSPAPPPARESTKLIIVAVILALVAVVLVNIYIQAIKSGTQEDTFNIFRLQVAKQPGDVLVAEDVQRRPIPESLRDSFRGAVSENAEGEPLRIGDKFTRAAEPNDLLTQSLFETADNDATRRLIKQGFRGVALPVVADRLPDPLKAEMRVDILAPVSTGGLRREIMVVMENVRVVSVGDVNIEDLNVTDTRRRGDNFSTLTVEVRPNEAILLTEISQQVQQVGVFHVLLRSPDDRQPLVIEDGGLNPDVLLRLGLNQE